MSVQMRGPYLMAADPSAGPIREQETSRAFIDNPPSIGYLDGRSAESRNIGHMTYQTIGEFVHRRAKALPDGPIGIVLCESELNAIDTAARLARQGVRVVIALGPGVASDKVDCEVFEIAERPTARSAPDQMNLLIDALAGRWIVWLWNAEFLVFPFCETRRLADLVAFLTDERRKSLYTYALDLYSQDLRDLDTSPTEAELFFDTAGYHAFPQANQQLTVFGGLGWRFQELLPKGMQQIGRTSLFRAERGVHLDDAMIFEDLDYASVSCPWHNSPTGAVMSLRRTRRIMAHPHFAQMRGKLEWSGTEPFSWHSRQLLEHGMIEPGQWF